MDDTFEHSYTCQQLLELPASSATQIYYPGSASSGGHDGVIIKVEPVGGSTWIGVFAFGDTRAAKAKTGVFSTPCPDKFCVVAKGAGYFVSANAPMSWESVAGESITDVRPIQPREILVFATDTDLVAYGPTGIEWRTERLSWDDLAITSVTDDIISGEFWDIQTESMEKFEVDLNTGNHRGGISEDLG